MRRFVHFAMALSLFACSSSESSSVVNFPPYPPDAGCPGDAGCPPSVCPDGPGCLPPGDCPGDVGCPPPPIDCNRECQPRPRPGHPTCTELGYDVGFDLAATNGIGTFRSPEGYLVVELDVAEGVRASFVASHSVAAAVVKGDDAANIYVFDPPRRAVRNLAAPNRGGNDTPALRGIELCYSYELTVHKTAATSLTRDVDWSIEKRVSPTALTLAEGAIGTVEATVVVTPRRTLERDRNVTGAIVITNDTPMPARITHVTDVVGSVRADVRCPMDLPLTLAPNATLTCSYATELPDTSPRTNVATVRTRGKRPFVHGASAWAHVSFANAAVTTVDGCVSVSDAPEGMPSAALGDACSPDGRTFTTSVPLRGDRCGQSTWRNTASFVGGSGETDSARASVAVTVACGGVGDAGVGEAGVGDAGIGDAGIDDASIDDAGADGSCTHSQGYWKTHSTYGPAPYDETWARLPTGADTPFFATGRTWYEIFWTEPEGSAYLILAVQYEAAILNALSGAATTTVEAELAAAEALLAGYATTPSAIPREEALTLAATLERFDTGVIGPGACPE